MYKTSYLQRQAEVAEVAKYRHHTCKYEQTCKKSKYVYIYLFAIILLYIYVAWPCECFGTWKLKASLMMKRHNDRQHIRNF